MNKEPDFHYRDNGTIITLIPFNVDAKNWIKNNLQVDSWQDIEFLPIEPRMFLSIMEGIKADGFLIEKS